MTINFHRYAFNDEAHKILSAWKKRYREKHNLDKDATITISDVLIDVNNFYEEKI